MIKYSLYPRSNWLSEIYPVRIVSFLAQGEEFYHYCLLLKHAHMIQSESLFDVGDNDAYCHIRIPYTCTSDPDISGELPNQDMMS